jgi:hypothetical protein
MLARVKRVEVGIAVNAQDDGLTIDDEMLLSVLQGSFSDPGLALGPVISAASYQLHAIPVSLLS